jgi:hypothetical protein
MLAEGGGKEIGRGGGAEPGGNEGHCAGHYPLQVPSATRLCKLGEGEGGAILPIHLCRDSSRVLRVRSYPTIGVLMKARHGIGGGAALLRNWMNCPRMAPSVSTPIHPAALSKTSLDSRSSCTGAVQACHLGILPLDPSIAHGGPFQDLQRRRY